MNSHYLLSAALLALPALAHAADAPGDITVTATRSGAAEEADLTGASVTVLSPEDMEARQTRILSDILRDVPGVAVSHAGGFGDLTQVRLRGAEGNQTLVLIDGIEVSDPYQGEYDFGGLLADPGARIEVLRGQQSSLYGSDAIGGVIQVVTASGRDRPGVSAQIEGGSFGTVDGSARIGGVAGDFDYAVSASGYHSHGFPTAEGGHRDVGADIGQVATKLNWRPTDNFTLTAVGRYAVTDADTNTQEGDPASPLFGHVVDTPSDHFRNRAAYGLIRAELSSLGGRWTNALTAQIADTLRSGYDYDVRTSGDHGGRIKGSYVSSLTLGGEAVRHRITFALDAERESFRNRDPSGYAFAGAKHQSNLGLVGEYELTLGDHAGFGASVRHDVNQHFGDDTTWRVQGSYIFSEGTRLHAAAGSGVKNPGFFDLYGYVSGQYIGNPNLKPEKSQGWEAGVGQRLLGGRISLDATWFQSRLTDEITTIYLPPDYTGTTVNSGGTSHQHGLELTASARLEGGWRIDAAYTWTHARAAGVEAVRRAPNIASVAVTWAPKDQPLSLTATIRYNGRQTDLAYTDPSYTPVTVHLKAYTLLGLNAAYKLGHGIELFGRIENALDQHYEEVFSYATPGRAVYGGVRVGF